ncbi:MAG: hypothetical protein KAT15_02080 [Bacteroidales bacterium]|nr:hypothetical protein [Bacteroidales bacterium]
MKYTFKILFLTIHILIISTNRMFSQTCCSGGVPLSGNIGFIGSEKGTLQMDLSYDLNYLTTLKNGSELYTDESRRRITQSLLLKTGYSINSRLAVDALLSFVNQGRRITYFEEVNQIQTNGIGDAVVIVKYVFSKSSESGIEIQLGAGPKIPLGRSDLTDDRGITLNADLQPGSSSWDLITWGYFAKQLKQRPSAAVSGRIVGRMNGANPNYLGSQSYKFGNSFQLYLGMGDQVNFRNAIFSTSLSLRFRKAFSDRINGLKLDNTGGQWINIIPSFGWHISQNTIIHILPEIPVYSKVEGIQLTPTFRLQAGIYHTFGRKNKYESKDFQL